MYEQKYRPQFSFSDGQEQSACAPSYKEEGRLSGEQKDVVSLTPGEFFDQLDSNLAQATESVEDGYLPSDWVRAPCSNEIFGDFHHITFSSREESEAFVSRLFVEYLGEENEEKWSVLSIDTESQVGEGDNFLLTAFMDMLAKDEHARDLLGPEGMQSVFARVLAYAKEKYVRFLHQGHTGSELEAGPWLDEGDQFEYEDMEDESISFDRGQEDLVIVNNAIRELAPYGNTETIDLLLDLLKERGPSVSRNMAYAFTAINPQYAAKEILSYLRGKESREKLKADQYEGMVREDLQRMLFRLEVGEMGVDEHGVEYLGRKYDLGMYNSAENVVHRITGYGDAAIYHKRQKKMLGVFSLFRETDADQGEHDAEDENIIRAEIRQIVLTDLFSHVAGERTPEYKEQQAILEKFKDGHYAHLLADFHKEVGVYLNNLSLREQAWFLLFLDTASAKDQDRAKQLVRAYGEDGLRSFIATEIDGAASGDIFQIANSPVREETKQALFAKYSDVIDHLETVEQDIRRFFATNTAPWLNRGDMTFGIAKRARKLLGDYANKVQSIPDEEQSRASRDILRELEKINVSILLFANIIKQMPREEVANLNLKDIPLIEKVQDMTGTELANHPELLEKIKTIIRKQFPEGDDIAFEKEVVGNNDMRLTISLADGEVLSFFTKKKIGEKMDYLDWFISNPDAEIKGLGEATIKMGFNADLKKGRSYYAVAKPHVKSFPISVNELGFSAFAGSTDDGEYKNHYVRLSRLPEDDRLVAKAMTGEQKEELKRTVQSVCVEPNRMYPLLFGGASFKVCKVEFGEGKQNSDDITKNDPDGWIMAEIERQYGKGRILTSYMPDSNERDNRVFYAVFEKDSHKEKRANMYDVAHAHAA